MAKGEDFRRLINWVRRVRVLERMTEDRICNGYVNSGYGVYCIGFSSLKKNSGSHRVRVQGAWLGGGERRGSGSRKQHKEGEEAGRGWG